MPKQFARVEPRRADHAFETKHHVHRDERLRGDVGVKIRG